MNKKTILYNFIYPIVAIAAVIAIWAVVAAVYGKPLILPTVSDTATEFVKLFANGDFYLAALMTFVRSVACFALAACFALPLSLLASRYRSVAAAFKPIVDFLRTVPVIAVILLTLVLFTSATIPIVVGFLTVFPLLYSALLEKLTSTEFLSQAEMCRLYQSSRRAKARYLYLPTVAPTFFVQTESLLPLAVKVVISGEVLAYTRNGIGLLMRSAQLNVETAQLVAYALVAVLLSFAAQLLARLLHVCFRRIRLCR